MKLKKIIFYFLINFGVPFLALLLSLLIGSLIILIVGGSPLSVLKNMFVESLTTGYGFGQVLQKTTQLIFAGLSVALAFKARLFNIGAEGQLIIGTFLIAFAGTIDFGLPAPAMIILCLAAGMAGGAIWGGITGLLKASFGVHEVITTIMLNFIAAALINWILGIPGMTPKETVHTYPIVNSAELLKLSSIFSIFAGSTVNISFFIALMVSILTWILLFKTKYGFMIRAVGLNLAASETYGISSKKIIIYTMALSGALAALVGSDFVMGYKYYYEMDFSAGIGFMGLAVALLAKNNPLAVIPSAFLFGILAYGKITLGTDVPKELVEIIQAIVIIMVVVLSSAARKTLYIFNS